MKKMQRKRVPVLLSFYALSNGTTNLLFGQLSSTSLDDLSFKEYSRRRTFQTIVGLYRSRAVRNEEIELKFDRGSVKTMTDESGGFYCKVAFTEDQHILSGVTLSSGEPVVMMDGLYSREVDHIDSSTIVVSDIDDTLLHSFIGNVVQKFRTLMFTAVENRKAVDNMEGIMNGFASSGAACVYLSNSEQNLHPLIFRFLRHNNFPPGPLFLKQMRRMRDVITNRKYPVRELHKLTQLDQLIELFPSKKYVLIGDNTQQDLPIYLTIAERFPDKVSHIIIRKVRERKQDTILIEGAAPLLKEHGITLFYESTFPKLYEL